MGSISTASVGLARLLVAGFISGLLAACSSLASQTATTVSPDPPKPGYASVYIGRPSGLNVSIFPVPIEVDGKPLMSLAPGHYTTVNLPPGRHSIGIPDETWARAIAGIPHPVEFAVEPGRTYYLLPRRWFADAGYRISVVGSVVVPERTAVSHITFSVQTAAANGAPPTEFNELGYVKAP